MQPHGAGAPLELDPEELEVPSVEPLELLVVADELVDDEEVAADEVAAVALVVAAPDVEEDEPLEVEDAVVPEAVLEVEVDIEVEDRLPPLEPSAAVLEVPTG